MLTLGGRSDGEAVVVVGLDRQFRVEPPDVRGQGHDVNHRRLRAEDALGRYDDPGMTKAGFATLGQSEVEIDNVTRGQHRARSSRRRAMAESVAGRSGPGAARARPG